MRLLSYLLLALFGAFSLVLAADSSAAENSTATNPLAALPLCAVCYLFLFLSFFLSEFGLTKVAKMSCVGCCEFYLPPNGRKVYM